MIKKKLIYILSFLTLTGIVVLMLFQSKPKVEMGFDNPEGYIEFFRGITIPFGKNESGYKPNNALNELKKAKGRAMNLKRATSLNWVSRGPGNVGGRTRTIIIDPDDSTGNTWFAGSVSGGVWKTTNGGQSWANLTSDLLNLSTVALAMAPSNHNVLYIGTGEGFGGEGMVSGGVIFRSGDKGNTWDSLASTARDERFRFVNKIWISPESDSILIAATNKGMFKTFDAGETWNAVGFKGYVIQDIIQNPLNPDVLYAGANSIGVLKSYDGGDTWQNSSEGFTDCYRVSLTISPVDTSYLYAGVEAPYLQTHIYQSTDAGKTWKLNQNADGQYINFHLTQGWFNNVVAAHPFDKRKVYVGGVYFGELEFKGNMSLSQPFVVRVDTFDTRSFMTFVNFGGTKLGGAMATGLNEDAEVEEEDFVSVEIRFGNGKLQKAHRYTVPEGEGAGVPVDQYYYQDYVNVPFEVWDTDNDKQLMVSFRDQDKNGEFNLIEREYGDDISGREYLFVSAYAYDSLAPNVKLSSDGGYIEKLLYFIWPALQDSAVWEPDSLPDSKIVIKYGAIMFQDAFTTVLADDRLNEELHVDHHDIKFFIRDSNNKLFDIIEANDGGLGFSSDEGKTWEQINKGYNTTQFYGVAKRPGAHEYVGGMQDNGTWQSPVDKPAGSLSEYDFKIEGDGFEALWHPWYPQRILGSSYNNYIKVSNDYGENWQWTSNNILGGGPFITKLSHSKENPDLVFAVGGHGVYKHINFGFGTYDWELVDLGDSWAVENIVTSMHNVKVSLADPSVVWAGGGMYKNPDLNIFLSKDYGVTFDTVTNYTDVRLGYISGMATHPVNPATAYLLYSFYKKPKILRTKDYGETWEDISGFGASETSSNGFPDVMVHDLLVFPNDTNKIWVATEIGIFEKVDEDSDWQFVDNGFPAVSVWQLDISDGQVIAATHGRGIWTADLGLSKVDNSAAEDYSLDVYPVPASTEVNITTESSYIGKVEISIYELSGKLVHKKELSKQNEYFTHKINLTEFTPGNYIITVEQGSNKTARKIILN